MKGRIIATGGAGYIGSHVVAELLGAGYQVVILDNFENAPRDIAERISGLGLPAPEVVEADCRDAAALDAVFAAAPVDAVVHFAGKKSVNESVAEPLLYYEWNVTGALRVLEAMQRHGVGRLVFSSSATVYGTTEDTPIPETAPVRPQSPYGQTKRMIEQVIDDLTRARPGFAAVSLRYFNPVGAYPGGRLGEMPSGEPANLFPYVTQTIVGLRPQVRVFGSDYDTPDGTGVRDYVHVCDLARGHLCALGRLFDADAAGQHRIVNLGTGRGYSVLEVISAFGRACGHEVPHALQPRRPGDVARSVADPGLAAALLDWRARFDLDAMCRDHLEAERRNREVQP